MSDELHSRTVLEISRIRMAGQVVAHVLTEVAKRIEPSTRTIDLNYLCEALIIRTGATPCMRGFGSFPTAAAFCVNDVAAHGVPDDRPLAAGDLVTVDVAVDVGGFKADGAWTFLVPGAPPSETLHRRRLLSAAWQCSLAGIAMARPPHRIGDIGARICRHAAREGFEVIARFTGHGVGRELHEEPTFHYASADGYGRQLIHGLVFTVEPVLGTSQLVEPTEDGFGFRTVDRSPTAQFEHTVAVNADTTEILTMPPIDIAKHAAKPPDFSAS